MLIKFDFSSKKGILVVKFAFATAILKIETLCMHRRFAHVLPGQHSTSVSGISQKVGAAHCVISFVASKINIHGD